MFTTVTPEKVYCQISFWEDFVGVFIAFFSLLNFEPLSNSRLCRAHLGRDRFSDDFGHVGTISPLPVRGVSYEWSAYILDASKS